MFGVADQEVTWVAEVTEPPQEQTILSARALKAEGHDDPLVEVVGLSHSGNGSAYIYQFHHRSLALLLKTPVIDQHDDGVVFGSPHHEIVYADRNGDSVADIEVVGTIITGGSTRPFSRVFVWDPAAGRFTPTRDRPVSRTL